MSNLGISLIITVLGMGLVFIAILLLWGLMEIVVKSTAKENTRKEAEDEGNIPESGGLKERVAAAAVAVALALRRSSGAASSLMTDERGAPSVWLAAGRLAALERPAPLKRKEG